MSEETQFTLTKPAAVKTAAKLIAPPGGGMGRAARRFIRLLLFVTAAILLVLGSYFYLQQREGHSTLFHASAFAGAQVEKDFLLLRVNVAEILAGRDDLPRKAALQSFDNISASLHGLGKGPGSAQILQNAALRDAFGRIQQSLARWQPMVQRFAAGDDAAGHDLLAAMAAATQDYHVFSSGADRAGLAHMDRVDERLYTVYWLLLVLFLLGLAAVAVTARMLLRQAELADAAHASLAQLARDLEAAKRQAEAANRAKSSFLASMSHELRTPLNAVIGFADIMHQGMFGPVGNPRYEEYVASIQQSGKHLLSLINDILDMSRIEAGRFELHEERLEIDDVVRDCLALVDVQARGKGVTVRRGKRHEGIELWADDRALRQMLLNLLSNAVKFTNQGGEASIEYGRNADGWFEIVVRDSGIGMNEAEVSRAFEPFARSGNQMIRQQFTGTGLGLPITRRLIELHGGRIEVVSRLGEGTSVTLRFPPERVSQLGDFGGMLGSGMI